MRYRILLMAALALIACNRPENPENPEDPENPGNSGAPGTPGKLTEIYVEGANSTYHDLPEFHLSRYSQKLRVPVKSPNGIWEWELESDQWISAKKVVKDTLDLSISTNTKNYNRRTSVTVRYGAEKGQYATFYVSQDKWIQSAFEDNEPWEDKEVPVDLGLSVLWGSVNVGATSPDRTGAYFSWGDPRLKADFYWEYYLYAGKTTLKVTKYCTNSRYGPVDNLMYLEPKDDPACVYLGGKWRSPNSTECSELANNCTVTYDTLNGNPVFILTSKKNGNSIIIPDSKYFTHEGLSGPYTYIWSSYLMISYPLRAVYLEFQPSKVRLGNDVLNRTQGATVRPVMDK